MPRLVRLHPFDLVVAARLLQPAGTLAALAHELGVVPSQIHAALGRLDDSGLLKSDQRATNPRAFAEFVAFGVRYAFPAQRRALTEGVPTAYSAEPLAASVDAVDVLVWPAAQATARLKGFAVAPLYTRAPILVERSPETYRLLTIIDAFRLGDARIRTFARAALETALGRRIGDS